MFKLADSISLIIANEFDQREIHILTSELKDMLESIFDICSTYGIHTRHIIRDFQPEINLISSFIFYYVSFNMNNSKTIGQEFFLLKLVQQYTENNQSWFELLKNKIYGILGLSISNTSQLSYFQDIDPLVIWILPMVYSLLPYLEVRSSYIQSYAMQSLMELSPSLVDDVLAISNQTNEINQNSTFFMRLQQAIKQTLNNSINESGSISSYIISVVRELHLWQFCRTER